MKSKRGVLIVVVLVVLGVFGLWYVSHAPTDIDSLIGSDLPDPAEQDGNDDVDVVTPPGAPAETPTEEPDTVFCTMDAKQCPDGSYVGRVGPDCEFAACPTETNDEPTAMTCSPESREAEACIEIYQPVCADVQVECITTPCEPVQETFSNSCFACANERVLSYAEGACVQ